MNVLCSQNAVKQRLTAAHELTHFIKEKSHENFEALERIVAEGFTKKKTLRK